MASHKVYIDDTRFPLVVCSLQGELTDADYDELFAASERLMSLRRSMIMITDVRELTKAANATQRKRLAERVFELDEKYGNLRAGSVLILKSAVMRGALTAYHWLAGKRHDEVVVADMDAALRAAEKFAAESGISIPPPARRAQV